MTQDEDRQERIRNLFQLMGHLSEAQILWLEAIVNQFLEPCFYRRLPSTDLISQRFLEDFGDALKIHHCFSAEPFTKDKFEHAFQHVASLCGFQASLASRGNPGHDLTLNGTKFSLKTQADSGLRHDTIHISKFMELGKGKWASDPADLIGLRLQFIKHMTAYDRILILRCLSKGPSNWEYELVEIPKKLLMEAEGGELEMRTTSDQMPKPGYCHVRSPSGEVKFQLYFDGGTERKLQIKGLRKDQCTVHASWKFSTRRFYGEQQTGFVLPPS